MTKQELIERVYRKRGGRKRRGGSSLTKKAVAEIVDGVFAELGDYFIKARGTRARPPRFTYPGFGTFTKKRRAARIGRHPRSGEPIEIAAADTVSFALGSELKALINDR